ncbi:DNA replication factor Dna2-domain-containing protein [Limtongia smithiae]|uniref:DNA replication factor Dna2-domain-containing protein n=1 Tax=Limtongia smithiae TaxID=1125753 RepID=UPI0034CD8288
MASRTRTEPEQRTPHCRSSSRAKACDPSEWTLKDDDRWNWRPAHPAAACLSPPRIRTPEFAEAGAAAAAAAAAEEEFKFEEDDIDFEILARIEAEVDLVVREDTLSRPLPVPTPSPSAYDMSRGRYARVRICSVREGSYVTRRGHSASERVLTTVPVLHPEQELIVRLRDEWTETDVALNDIANLIAPVTAGEYIIDRDSGLLILFPDVLVPTPTIAESFKCLRKAVLSNAVRGPNDGFALQLYGQIVVEIIHICMLKLDFSSAFMNAVLDELIPKYFARFVFLERFAVVRHEVEQRFTIIQKWARQTMAASRWRRPNRYSDGLQVSVYDLINDVDVVLSPMYGIQGKVNLTVSASIDGLSPSTMPFDIRTGRNAQNLTHRVTATLNMLLLTDRYSTEIDRSLIYYPDLGEMFAVFLRPTEIGALMRVRNRVAHAMTRHISTVPLIDDAEICNSCSVKQACYTYHTSFSSTAPVPQQRDYADTIPHLTPSEREFFMRWDTALDYEEQYLMRREPELWLLGSDERECLGRCFMQMELVSKSNRPSLHGPTKYAYVFKRSSSEDPKTWFASFVDSEIDIGDPVMVSDEQGNLSLAKGTVEKTSFTELTLITDRELDLNPLIKSIQERQDVPVTYRIDKTDYLHGFAVVRNNLCQLLARDANPRHKELIVNLAKPQFDYRGVGARFHEDAPVELNRDQRLAVKTVLAAKDYALIVGLSGTGKTITTAQVIRSLVAEGNTVLVISHLLKYLDDILLQLRGYEIKILRLGAVRRIDPDVNEFALNEERLPRSPYKFGETMAKMQVVAVTALGINTRLLQEKRFDYCIIDDAALSTLPVNIGPLRLADKFVLVGDYQSAPKIFDSKSLEAGLGVSLLKLLCDAHPEAVVTMEYQYRMCEEVTMVANAVGYDDKLCCGTEAIAKQFLVLPRLQSALADIHARESGVPHTECWLANVLAESTKVAFINTDNTPATESANGIYVSNEVEAELVAHLTTTLIASGVAAEQLGIYSPYRTQTQAVAQCLRRYTPARPLIASLDHARNIVTKDCVIISLVRTAAQITPSPEFIHAWRFLPRAMTRARMKLVVLGSQSALAQIDMLTTFFSLVGEKGWVYKVPADAVGMHIFPPVREMQELERDGVRVSMLGGKGLKKMSESQDSFRITAAEGRKGGYSRRQYQTRQSPPHKEYKAQQRQPGFIQRQQHQQQQWQPREQQQHLERHETREQQYTHQRWNNNRKLSGDFRDRKPRTTTDSRAGSPDAQYRGPHAPQVFGRRPQLVPPGDVTRREW